MSWISVKDKLPEMSYFVLTWFVDYNGLGGYQIDSHDGERWGEATVWDGIVTHWMPMPEPPNTPPNAEKDANFCGHAYCDLHKSNVGCEEKDCRDRTIVSLDVEPAPCGENKSCSGCIEHGKCEWVV